MYIVNEVVVKKFMTKKEDNPMPFVRMAGFRLRETQKAVYMRCRGEIFSNKEEYCACCGRPITNPISQYFGVGPICGGHNYVNPFSSDAELKQAVKDYRENHLHQIVWEGWIPKSAIISEVPMNNNN